MDKAAFFKALREHGGPFKRISQGQITGIEAILDAAKRAGMRNAHHVANVLAQVHRETGGRMVPVRETFATSDAQAIDRLEKAWKAGKLSWVRTPYWRDGWFGRGHIQLTHRDNYDRVGRLLGVDLVGDPSRALHSDTSADIAVRGMAEGWFTGKRLDQYEFPLALEAPASKNPRRIVNGPDGSDEDVAGYHRAYHAALVAGGWSIAPHQRPAPVETQGGLVARFFAAIVAILRGKA